MSKLTNDEVKHVAKLARLELSNEEVEMFVPQLSGVLEYFKVLDETNTDGVKPTNQVTGLENVSFEDEIVASDGSSLLECSPLDVKDNLIKVKKVI